jgi:hypothetical protein
MFNRNIEMIYAEWQPPADVPAEPTPPELPQELPDTEPSAPEEIPGTPVEPGTEPAPESVLTLDKIFTASSVLTNV